VTVETALYRLELAQNGRYANLTSPSGEHWLTLSLLAALDTTEKTDETLELSEPRVDGRVLEVDRRSTAWERAGITIECRDDELEVHTWVSGSAALTNVHLLGGRLIAPGAPTGLMLTGSSLTTLFTPNPEDALPRLRGAGESAVIGVIGDGDPGRGHWLFSPAPLFLALGRDEDAAEWLGLSLVAPVGELAFTELAYRPSQRAFQLALDYDGHTRVEGRFEAPAVVIAPGIADVHDGLRRDRARLVARGHAPAAVPRRVPSWWSEPIFCGWGAQCAVAEREPGRLGRDFAAQARYDEWLAHLEERGVVPGTVVLDDKWQATYGRNEPDVDKWPDLRGWIARRHERGQHVLLWWKAWDPEGLPDELCVRNVGGAAVAFDPSNPAASDELRRIIAAMLGPDGLDADGLKIDFTARTPSGRALAHHGPEWGIALLHRLLATVYEAAKDAKPDALLITHTPHPSFVDVTDMIRLNDIIRTGEVPATTYLVPQMRFRAEVARAACPEVLIDTDDWCVPDKESWREFLAIKPQLGVPSLYYATHLDATGEELDDDDYSALRSVWAEWRAAPRVEQVA
jgi:hypothetical protein